MQSSVGVVLDRLAYDYRYAPPEMFLGGQTLGPQSDFYALGCLAYELLCGEPPFVSDNFHELAARHINDPIIPPSRRGSQFGERWDAVILKLLARFPAERYGTLGEVQEAFLSLESGKMKCFIEEGFALPPTPLLREASLVNYQGGQSLLNFDQTGNVLPEAKLAWIPTGG